MSTVDKQNLLPLVAVASIRPFVDALATNAVDAKPLLEAVGLPEPTADPGQMIPVQAWYDFAEAVSAELNDKHAGYKIGFRRSIASFAHGEFLRLENATLGEILNTMITDYSRLGNYVSYRLINDGTWFSIEAKRLFTPWAKPVQMDGFGVGHIMQLVGRFVGPAWDGHKFRASVVDPTAIPASALPRSSLLRSSKRNVALRFPAEWLLFCEGGKRRQPEVVGSSSPSVFIEDIRHILVLHVSEPDLTIDKVAKYVAVPPWALRRCFSSSATSFRRELDAIRMDRAKSLLQNTDMTIAEVQQAVGYIDASAFARAFKKKTGETPSRARRKTKLPS